jgi:hypothetical protein
MSMSIRKEDNLQIACVKWYKLQYKDKLITSFPAGYVFSGDRTKRMITGKRMKDMGYLNGTPDIFIPEPNDKFCGLFIELKVKGGHLQPSQKEVLAKLHAKGYQCEVCYTLEEFMEKTNKYMKGI